MQMVLARGVTIDGPSSPLMVAQTRLAPLLQSIGSITDGHSPFEGCHDGPQKKILLKTHQWQP